MNNFKNFKPIEKSKFKKEYIEFRKNEFIKVEYKKNLNNKKCIIWIPGRNDYFFHYHFTEKFSNYDIYSIMFKNNHARRNDIIHHVDDIKEHFIEIDTLYENYDINNYEEVILYGHSTGGLISVLYYKNNLKNKISKLILNSPFFKFKRHWLENFFLDYIAWYVFDFLPNIDISFNTFNTNTYMLSLSENYKINKKYKTDYDVPVISSWIVNNIKHQYKIQLGNININIPTLVLYCDKTVKNNFSQKGDSILHIDDNIKQLSNLFKDQTFLKLEIISNGVHDLLCADGEINNIDTPLGKTFDTINKFL